MKFFACRALAMCGKITNFVVTDYKNDYGKQQRNPGSRP